MTRLVELQDGVLLSVHDAGDSFSDRIVRERDYFERDILHYLCENYPTQQCIIDVGANIGNHTVYFATYLEYKAIVCIEPIDDNFVLLKENTKDFGAIFLRHGVAGDSTETVKLAIRRENMGACEIVNDYSDEPDFQIAPQIRLDDLFVPKVTLIKIDVEWYEPYVLEGAKNLIEEDKPLILIEDTDKKYGPLLPDYYRLLKEWPEHNTYLYGVPHHGAT